MWRLEVLLLLLLLLLLLEGTGAFYVPVPTAGRATLPPCRQHPHSAPSHLDDRRRLRQQQGGPLWSAASSSSASGGGEAGAGAGEGAPGTGSVVFSDDWKRMVEEGIPIDLGDFAPVPGIMEAPPEPPRPRANEYGVVFPGALEQSEAESQAFLRAFKQTQRGRDAALPGVGAWVWWRMGSEAQRVWLAEAAATQAQAQAQALQAPTRGGTASPPSPPSASSASNALIFKLRGRLLGPTRVRYDAARGRFALAETPLLERAWPLRALPAPLRYPLAVARPVYAPLFCLRWLALRAFVLWRALRQFVLPSWPYLLLFTARAAYLLAACALLTVAVDELLQPLAGGIYQAVARLVGDAGLVLPDFRGYSLKPGGRVADEQAKTWVERWSEPLVAGAGVGGG